MLFAKSLLAVPLINFMVNIPFRVGLDVR